MNIEIKDKLYKSINEYCIFNGINTLSYINDLINKGYMIDKYGDKPSILQKESNNKKEEEKVDIIVVDDIPKNIEEKPKRKYNKKPKENISKEPIIDKPINDNVEQNDIIQEEVKEVEVVKTKKRKLK